MTRTEGRDRDATKARLIAALEALVAEEGFGAVGINAVARRADADKVLIYRYFGDLAGLMAACAEEGEFWWRVEDILAEPLAGPGDADGLVAALTTVFARHVDFLRRHPLTLEVIAWEMSERNALTRAFESVRESRSAEMMDRLAARFGVEPGRFAVHYGPAVALLGASANYLAVQGRHIARFSGIDLSAAAGWAALERGAREMIAGAVAAGPAGRAAPGTDPDTPAAGPASDEGETT